VGARQGPRPHRDDDALCQDPHRRRPHDHADRALGPGAAARAPAGRGGAGVTQVEEAPQLTETFALGSYGGDPAILLAVLRAIAKDPTAAGRALAAEDPGQAVADLSAD
jgi:hypothetical protein